MSDLSDVQKELNKLADPKRAKASVWYFKTGPGEYGEGDKFLGIAVPKCRKVALKFSDLDFSAIKTLLTSPYHEHRFVALEILVIKYERGEVKEKRRVVDFYLINKKFINNWDLVDTSAPYILGDYLLGRNKGVLYKLAKSKSIWDRRIAVITTQGFIRQGQFEDILKIAEILINDKHDLIQKAVGWMLREVGSRSLSVELKFLDRNYKKMPRTMLRYAIEKLPEKKRQFYLGK